MKERKPFRSKIAGLHRMLKRYGKVLVAFSGGKDSFFLLQQAVAALGAANVQCRFVATPFTSENSRRRISYFQKLIPIPIREIPLDLLANPRIRRNPPDRCYHCKTMLFSLLNNEASREGIPVVMDGTTFSDLSEHRPGRRALSEQGIVSPLLAVGINSREIVAFLRRISVLADFLHTSTCLATRFPYDHPLDPGEIAGIARLESWLLGKKIAPLRVRYMEHGVRIETAEGNFPLLLALRPQLLRFARSRGFHFITLDLEGFRSGSWDIARPSGPPA